MTNIITTTEVQQKIGQISNSIGVNVYVVTNRGKGRIVMLPYFDGCDENVMDYMEDFEMAKNAAKLKAKYSASSKSGKGELEV